MSTDFTCFHQDLFSIDSSASSCAHFYSTVLKKLTTFLGVTHATMWLRSCDPAIDNLPDLSSDYCLVAAEGVAWSEIPSTRISPRDGLVGRTLTLAKCGRRYVETPWPNWCPSVRNKSLIKLLDKHNAFSIPLVDLKKKDHCVYGVVSLFWRQPQLATPQILEQLQILLSGLFSQYKSDLRDDLNHNLLSAFAPGVNISHAIRQSRSIILKYTGCAASFVISSESYVSRAAGRESVPHLIYTRAKSVRIRRNQIVLDEDALGRRSLSVPDNHRAYRLQRGTDFFGVACFYPRTKRGRRSHLTFLEDFVLHSAVDLITTQIHILDREAAREALLARIPHDTRMPISGAKAKLDLTKIILREEIGQKLPDELYLNLEDINLFLRISLDLLNECFKPVGKLDVNYDYFRSIIPAIEKTLKPIADIRKIRLYHDVSALPEKLFMDKNKMTLAIFNLMANAVKYADKGTRVEIIGMIHGNDMIIDFTDYGIAIKTRDKERVFRDGFRAVTAKRRTPEGSGWGLPNARDYVSSHGGTLTVKSSFNPTTFRLMLPAALARSPQALRKGPN